MTSGTCISTRDPATKSIENSLFVRRVVPCIQTFHNQAIFVAFVLLIGGIPSVVSHPLIANQGVINGKFCLWEGHRGVEDAGIKIIMEYD